jgi:hypothetical protein
VIVMGSRQDRPLGGSRLEVWRLQADGELGSGGDDMGRHEGIDLY